MSAITTVAEIKNLLIIANSGRLLAQAAENIGYSPLVIDCFLDKDTQNISLEGIKVSSLAIENIARAYALFNAKYTLTHAIYGSGFEAYPDSLEFLSQRLIMLGNTVDVFSAIQNKTYFFSRLNYLKIPHPKVSFQVPKIKGNWLLKPQQGEGGLGIKKFNHLDNSPHSGYWQEYINGKSLSVMFLADGRHFKICGFQQQLAISVAENEFIFAGVISQPKINKAIRWQLTQWLISLVSDFSLQGINTLDFIVADKGIYVLEINARPSASMQLYEKNLLSKHINVFTQGVLDSVKELASYQAYQIIFASTDTFINAGIKWADWVFDRPQTDSIIHTGMPICSIIAGGKNEQQMNDLLLDRHNVIKQLLL